MISKVSTFNEVCSCWEPLIETCSSQFIATRKNFKAPLILSILIPNSFEINLTTLFLEVLNSVQRKWRDHDVNYSQSLYLIIFLISIFRIPFYVLDLICYIES